MEFWQALAWMEPEQLVDVARLAEDCGFAGVMTADHALFPRELRTPYPYSADGKPPLDGDSPYPDAMAITAAMAAVTRRLQFVCGVYVLPLRHPVEVAKTTATLAMLSQGRFRLGAGSGWMKEEFDALGVDFASRGRRLDESLALLRRLWGGDWVEHRGEFFEFDAIKLSPPPPAPIPVWLGGAAPRALRRAAAIADGWIGTGNHPDEVPALLAELKRLRAEAGRGDEPFYTLVGLSAPASLDTVKRLGELGMTATVRYPFRYTLGERSSLEDKRRDLERYAEDVIRHFQ
jgi:probable F420-dependent oxidoreductase